MSTKVLKTTNYNSFKLINGNRHISNNHVKHLAEAMRDRPETNSVRPILVNGDMEIIDGQHRFEACKLLNEPIYYIKGEGLTLEDAQRLNATQRNWSPMDYAYSFAIAGDESYQQYLDFRAEYKLPHNTTLAYLTQNINVPGMAQVFRDGMFKVKDIDLAHKIAGQLLEVGAVSKEYRRRYFGISFLLMATNPKYRHKHFVQAVEKHGSKYLARYENLSDYIRAFEAVYNFHLPVKSQIMLRVDLTSL